MCTGRIIVYNYYDYYPILAAPAVPVIITLISDLANGSEVENDVMTRRDKYERPILYVNKNDYCI